MTVWGSGSQHSLSSPVKMKIPLQEIWFGLVKFDLCYNGLEWQRLDISTFHLFNSF